MSLTDLDVETLQGEKTTFGELTGGRTTLLVNVASKCGLTPQYAGLEELHETYADRGFAVVGVPCNQFGGQEPGSAEEIAEFCSATYGVSFPMTEKVDVNGEDRHEIYQELVTVPNEKGRVGDVEWNFEKFLLAADGAVVARFNAGVEPHDPILVAAIEAQLA